VSGASRTIHDGVLCHVAKGRQKLRVANAGQSQPLLYKQGRCGKIEIDGISAGHFEEVTYDEWSVTLESGNILVFHSDGIAETMNSEGQFLRHDADYEADRTAPRSVRDGNCRRDSPRGRLVHAERSRFRMTGPWWSRSPMSHSSNTPSRKLKYADPASFTPHFAWEKSGGAERERRKK